MKNRLIAALLALAIGAPLYLLSANAAPAAAAASAGPARAVSMLKSLPGAAALSEALSLSAVDAETDAKIRAALRDTLHSATVLLISHRVTTLMQADRILVLDGGRVSALGTHRELIDRPGIYRDIYDIQMRSDDRALVEEGGQD